MVAPTLAARRAALLHVTLGVVAAVVVAVVFALVGMGVLWGLVLGVVAGGCALALLYVRQEQIVLRAVGAEPLAAGEQPRLENLVAGLCVANGFRSPELYVVREPAPNMMALGRSPHHSTLVVTTGLVERLGRVELEGLIAHELMRVRNRTTLLESSVAILVLRPLAFAPSLASSLAARLLDARTSAEIDVASVGLTRYPPGLASALRSLRADGRVPATDPVAYRHLWVDPPEGALTPQDFDLDDRIAVLEEL